MKRRGYLKVLGKFGIASLLACKNFKMLPNNYCNKCKEAWEGLSKFNRERYQFRYIEPTAQLPKVFLYGDSISIGYTEYVRASLEGKADVMRLHLNGGSSDVFIERMEAFRKAMFQPSLKDGWSFTWDVIHFNVGLHDLKYIYDGKLNKEKGEQVSSLEIYKKNLVSIISYLKKTYPTTKLIFATTTPVPEGEPGRVEGDAKRYNEVALELLKGHRDILVNDLYTYSKPVLETHGVDYGNVHFKAEGSRLLGIEVAQVIGKTIKVEPNKCPSTEVITAKFEAYESEKKK